MKEDHKRDYLTGEILLKNPAPDTCLQIMHIIAKLALNKLMMNEALRGARFEGRTVKDARTEDILFRIKRDIEQAEEANSRDAEQTTNFCRELPGGEK